MPFDCLQFRRCGAGCLAFRARSLALRVTDCCGCDIEIISLFDGRELLHNAIDFDSLFTRDLASVELNQVSKMNEGGVNRTDVPRPEF